MQKLKNILKRSVGIILFAFIPGMAAGSPTVGWLMGGITGVLTVFSSIIIFFGVQLAWDADISDQDIEKGFRAAVAKAAADNKDVAEAVKQNAADTPSDFGDLTDLFDDNDDHIPNPVTEAEAAAPAAAPAVDAPAVDFPAAPVAPAVNPYYNGSTPTA